ncbi:S41 family peptidase [Chloroflexota bacterium]
MSKKIKIIVMVISLVVILALSFGAGCTLGARTIPNAGSGLEVVEEAWNIIFQDYVDKEKLDADALSRGAIKGILEALDDPYTSYLEPEIYNMSLSSLEGKFEGIGAQVSLKDEQLVIIAPIAGSPAAGAGIRPGDVILEINGTSASGISLVEAVSRIRGPKGTPVMLLVLHQNETEPEIIEIIRDEIELLSVHSEMMEDLAYINISHFSERTNEELSTTLQSINEKAATGIILDLRSNPGGAVGAVVDVASHFLKEGVVLNIVDNRGEQTAMSVKSGGTTIDLPLVILVDSFSASGSEVLAGALQDYGRATVAGTKTFGKGSVNIIRELKDGSGLYVTTARWLTPNGRLIEGEGLYPDYELELEGDDAIQWAKDYLRSNK